jgi:hypothetical protein
MHRPAKVVGVVDNGGVLFVVELSSRHAAGKARVLRLRPGKEDGL